MTQVGSADVSVIAHDWFLPHAFINDAEVAGRAEIVIIAEGAVHSAMEAPGFWIARVAGTVVLIGATDGVPGAGTVGTKVRMGASIAIVAGPSRIPVDAEPGNGVAGIDGAEVAIVAARGRTCSADPVDTPVPNSAETAVVARNEEVLYQTPGEGVTGIGGTGIPIFARNCQPATDSISTLIGVGAQVAIAARRHICGMETANRRVADIISTGIVVIADDA